MGRQLKRINVAVSFFLIFVFLLLFSACKKGEEELIEFYDNFSIHFLDVGESDCTFIRFPDGKNMVVDFPSDSNYYEKVKSSLSVYGVGKIDYLVISNPLDEFCVGAYNLLNDYAVGKAFIPKLIDENLFPSFKSLHTLLNGKADSVVISERQQFIVGVGYEVLFLSPDLTSSKDGEYAVLNGSATPTRDEALSVSPIIYLSYKGVRFVLSSGANVKAEENALSAYLTGLYEKKYFKDSGVEVDLYDVEYLKIGRHGNNASTSAEFLDVLKPKTAIISVGGRNNYGNPSQNVLNRLYTANESCVLFRTDTSGDVSVFIDSEGVKTIKNQKRYL